MSTGDDDASANFDDRLRQRESQRHALETIPTPSAANPHENIPNTPLAATIISFILGCIFSIGFITFVAGGFNAYWWTTRQLGFFLAAWSAFHWGEYAVTAGWNLEKCSVDSFLLDNGRLYHLANGAAVAEYLLTLYFMPSAKAYPLVSNIGIVIVLIGQALRSTAMIHASTSFSHAIAYQKRENHKLVTDGVYAWFRHPSYAGFFYWALGTQLVLQNVLSFAAFTVLLWKFFYLRTRYEEYSLIKFFGDDYIQYRRRVGTKIPFIP